MASKLCDSCKSATAALFCRADSAFLCLSCDSKVHAANKLASRHARVWMCEVCEHAPASVTCKADAAALCATCDRDIHSANPLARRHERVPVTPFYDAVSSASASAPAVKHSAINLLDDRYFSDADGDAEEAEAASWLLTNPPAGKTMESADLSSGQYLFMDPYSDLEVDAKIEAQEQNSSGADCVVPVQSENIQAPLMNDHCFELDFNGPKPFAYGFNSQCLSHSVSSSSLDVGIVPDGGSMADISNPYSRTMGSGMPESATVPLSAVDREARVMRYREKRKNRKFEKTIRYASRKAYAETRPRIKGRFAKRTDIGAEIEADRSGLYGFGVVPSF